RRGGRGHVHPFVEVANAEFPTVADEHGVTSRLFDFKKVPNGILVDTAGTIRYFKHGGFSIDNPDDVAAVERFLSGEDPGPAPESTAAYTLGPVEKELVDTKLRLGRLLDNAGKRDEALAEWQSALYLDPENLVIRKQIWSVKYPEKFHPTIDFDWQKQQLASEREAEIAAGICGPDGCPLPRA
ncbi:MAG TPA: hypothetical protein VHG52_14925, partial [Thermomicrobiales bacterium]|nr:hypothetical protein [Thermomicrobiales bacterium]